MQTQAMIEDVMRNQSNELVKASRAELAQVRSEQQLVTETTMGVSRATAEQLSELRQQHEQLMLRLSGERGPLSQDQQSVVEKAAQLAAQQATTVALTQVKEMQDQFAKSIQDNTRLMGAHIESPAPLHTAPYPSAFHSIPGAEAAADDERATAAQLRGRASVEQLPTTAIVKMVELKTKLETQEQAHADMVAKLDERNAATMFELRNVREELLDTPRMGRSPAVFATYPNEEAHEQVSTCAAADTVELVELRKRLDASEEAHRDTVATLDSRNETTLAELRAMRDEMRHQELLRAQNSQAMPQQMESMMVAIMSAQAKHDRDREQSYQEVKMEKLRLQQMRRNDSEDNLTKNVSDQIGRLKQELAMANAEHRQMVQKIDARNETTLVELKNVREQLGERNENDVKIRRLVGAKNAQQENILKTAVQDALARLADLQQKVDEKDKSHTHMVSKLDRKTHATSSEIHALRDQIHALVNSDRAIRHTFSVQDTKALTDLGVIGSTPLGSPQSARKTTPKRVAHTGSIKSPPSLNTVPPYTSSAVASPTSGGSDGGYVENHRSASRTSLPYQYNDGESQPSQNYDDVPRASSKEDAQPRISRRGSLSSLAYVPQAEHGNSSELDRVFRLRYQTGSITGAVPGIDGDEDGILEPIELIEQTAVDSAAERSQYTSPVLGQPSTSLLVTPRASNSSVERGPSPLATSSSALPASSGQLEARAVPATQRLSAEHRDSANSFLNYVSNLGAEDDGFENDVDQASSPDVQAAPADNEVVWPVSPSVPVADTTIISEFNPHDAATSPATSPDNFRGQARVGSDADVFPPTVETARAPMTARGSAHEYSSFPQPRARSSLSEIEINPNMKEAYECETGSSFRIRTGTVSGADTSRAAALESPDDQPNALVLDAPSSNLPSRKSSDSSYALETNAPAVTSEFMQLHAKLAQRRGSAASTLSYQEQQSTALAVEPKTDSVAVLGQESVRDQNSPPVPAEALIADDSSSLSRSDWTRGVARGHVQRRGSAASTMSAKSFQEEQSTALAADPETDGVAVLGQESVSAQNSPAEVLIADDSSRLSRSDWTRGVTRGHAPKPVRPATPEMERSSVGEVVFSPVAHSHEDTQEHVSAIGTYDSALKSASSAIAQPPQAAPRKLYSGEQDAADDAIHAKYSSLFSVKRSSHTDSEDGELPQTPSAQTIIPFLAQELEQRHSLETGVEEELFPPQPATPSGLDSSSNESDFDEPPPVPTQLYSYDSDDESVSGFEICGGVLGQGVQYTACLSFALPVRFFFNVGPDVDAGIDCQCFLCRALHNAGSIATDQPWLSQR